MNAKLLVVIGNTTKREVLLQLPTVLGRSREADITVAHPLVSRRHCEISESNGLLLLRDLTSLNGTMVGGRRIEMAPLLPQGEFTIGPLTFRVLYEYDGNLESVPATRFVDAEEAATELGVSDATSAQPEEVPMQEIDAELPAVSASESSLGDVEMPDFLALADAEPEEALPAASRPAAQRPLVGPRRDVLDEPLDMDSGLQSGGYRRESPWAVEPPAVERLRPEPKPSGAKGPAAAEEEPSAAEAKAPPETPSDVTAAEKAAKQPPKKTPPAAKPPRKPTDSDYMDPEFGSFLEDLH